MPELHNLTPPLTSFWTRASRWRWHRRADAGASGKVPAAIHVTRGGRRGPAAYVRTGDVIRVDATKGVLEIKVDRSDLMGSQAAADPGSQPGYGRELFGLMRRAAGPGRRRRFAACSSGLGAEALLQRLVGDVGGTNVRFAWLTRKPCAQPACLCRPRNSPP